MSRAALVTGCTGFLGRALCARLLERDTEVIGLCRPSSNADRLPAGVTVVRSSFEESALRDALAPHRFGRVFHLAASGVNPARRELDELVDGNVEVTRALQFALGDRELESFVHVGSCSEYAPSGADFIAEDTELAPTSSYGGIKAATGLLARTLAQAFGHPFVGARLFGTYGPGEGPSRLIPHLFDRLTAGRAAELTPGDQLRDFTFVGDAADGLCRLASADASGQFVNLCTGVGTAVRDVALEVARAVGADTDLLHFGARPHRPDEPRRIVGCTERLRALTDWVPPTTLADGVAHTCGALRERQARQPLEGQRP